MLSGALSSVYTVLGRRLHFDRHDAELQVRAAVLDRFTRLGTPASVLSVVKHSTNSGSSASVNSD
jgi:hypothetical protein